MTRLVNHTRDAVRKTLRRFGYVMPERLTYKKMARLFYFADLFKRIERVEGAIIECGVAYGDSLVVLAALAHREGKGRRVVGFDSFEGFPTPSSADASARNPQKGDFGDASMATVRGLFRRSGLAAPELNKGFLSDTLPSWKESIALIHIDVDLYDRYRDIFTYLYPLLTKGGIIAFDEYREPKWPGATKAVDEFVAANGLALEHDRAAGKYYLVKPAQ